MPDLHQVVDQIRAFVQSSDQTRSALLDGLASAYAEACAGVNQRLARCQRLLQHGLRSEAIQLAESEPKLLAASAALDFPERELGRAGRDVWLDGRRQDPGCGRAVVERGLRRARAAGGPSTHPSPASPSEISLAGPNQHDQAACRSGPKKRDLGRRPPNL